MNSTFVSLSVIEVRLKSLEAFINNSVTSYNNAEARVNKSALLGQIGAKTSAGGSGSEDKVKEKPKKGFFDGFLNELSKVKDEVEGFVVKTEQSVVDEIKHLGMDDLKAMGDFLLDASGVGGALDAVKAVGNFLEDHPAIVATLTIIGGVALIVCTGGVAACVIGGLVIAFGASDLGGELTGHNLIQEGMSKGTSAILSSSFSAVTNAIYNDPEMGKKYGEKFGAELGAGAYDLIDFGLTVASVVVDPAAIGASAAKATKIVKGVSEVTKVVKEVKVVKEAGMAERTFNAIKGIPEKARNYKGVFNGDWNVFKAPDAIKDLSRTSSEFTKFKEIIKIKGIDEFAKYGTEKRIYKNFLKAKDAFYGTVGNAIKPGTFANDLESIKESPFVEGLENFANSF